MTVLLYDLIWGGEVVSVPCLSAVGTVVCEDQASLQAAGVSDCLHVDFGAYLGVQSIPRSACRELDCFDVLPSDSNEILDSTFVGDKSI